jgi:hypothetical protein
MRRLLRCTESIGVAEMLVYEAEHGGRNRVMAAADTDTATLALLS